MRIIILAGAKADLRWFKRYYMQVFPEGRVTANEQFAALLQLLRTSPMIGVEAEGHSNVREFPIRRTPFTVLYRVRAKHIEILRVFDQRSSFANER